MFILEEPFASDFLIDTAERLRIPTLRAPFAESAAGERSLMWTNDKTFRAAYAFTPGARLYTNSENALQWVADNLGHTQLAGAVARCKDKARFRRELAPLHQEFRFEEISFAQLDEFDPKAFGKPFVIKPSVGFFSIGVHVVPTPEAWPGALVALKAEMAEVEKKFPSAVIGATNFIAEEVVQGDEFAVDVYFDAKCRPVVLNILRHEFSDASDVSDRTYYTDQQLMRSRLEPFTEYLTRMGALLTACNMPMHVELRVTPNGDIVPIEANPLRFAGWCTTDIARHAWGINPYEAYLTDTPPDWNAIFEARADKAEYRYSIIVADLPGSLDPASVESIDFDAFRSRFSSPLELRPVDWQRFGVFAFLFAETAPEHRDELDWIVAADLSEFAAS